MTAKASPTLRGTILVLEEEPGTRGLIGRVLTSAGATVHEVADLEGALAAMAKAPPDLLITALKLTGRMDGAGLARNLKGNSRTKGLPILMLAPRSSPEDVLACLDAGADDIVSKPFFVPELVARVRAHLRARRLYDALSREKKELETLLEIHESLARQTEPEGVLEALVKIIARVLGAKRASIVLASRDPRYGYAMAASDTPGMRNLEIDLRRYPEIARVMKTQRPLVVEDASASSLFANLAPALSAARIKSILAVPVVIDGEAVATLLLHTRDERKKFSQREIRLCSIAAQTAGMALRDARLFGITRGKGKQT